MSARGKLIATAGVALAAAAFVTSAPLPAQQGVQMQTSISARRVEVGQVLELQLVALSSGGQSPSNPRLPVPPGFSVRGPNVSTQQQVSISGGSIQQRQGITATWLLTPSRAGIYRVGPPTVLADGQTVSGQAVQVEVVPKGQGDPSQPGRTPGRPQRPFDPFDPFDFFRHGLPQLPGLKFPDEEGNELDALPAIPEEYRVDRAPDRSAFLRATVTPDHATLGQQVTLRIYAYGRRGAFREANTSEPSKPDFLSYSIVDNAQNETMYRVPIGDDIWYAVKIRELALFPIRSGTLRIGPLRMGFEGRGYAGGVSGQMLTRESPALDVIVNEPPVDKRPPGYELGTVGRFSLGATVEPRTITAGEAVSVVVKLDGVGNLPSKLRTPQQNGLDWLEPTLVENIEPREGRMQGFRKFSYVLRLDEPGRVELGEITLPYWDPERKRYDVARAELGAVTVKPAPGGSAAARKPAAKDGLSALVVPRTTLGSEPPPRTLLSDKSWFWLALAGGPLSVLLFGGGLSASRRLKHALQARARAADTLSNEALKRAREAAVSGDNARAAGEVERALFLTIEHASGLRARAVLKERLAGELESVGATPELARETVAALTACDELRFVQGSGAEAEALVARAAALAPRLSKLGGARRRDTSQ